LHDYIYQLDIYYYDTIKVLYGRELWGCKNIGVKNLYFICYLSSDSELLNEINSLVVLT